MSMTLDIPRNLRNIDAIELSCVDEFGSVAAMVVPRNAGQNSKQFRMLVVHNAEFLSDLHNAYVMVCVMGRTFRNTRASNRVYP